MHRVCEELQVGRRSVRTSKVSPGSAVPREGDQRGSSSRPGSRRRRSSGPPRLLCSRMSRRRGGQDDDSGRPATHLLGPVYRTQSSAASAEVLGESVPSCSGFNLSVTGAVPFVYRVIEVNGNPANKGQLTVVTGKIETQQTGTETCLPRFCDRKKYMQVAHIGPYHSLVQIPTQGSLS